MKPPFQNLCPLLDEERFKLDALLSNEEDVDKQLTLYGRIWGILRAQTIIYELMCGEEVKISND